MLRRKWLVAGVAGSLAAVGVVLLAASLVWVPKSSAQQGKEPAEARAEKVGQLPLAQVVLFSSGVGYFQREGTVEGNTRVDLSFQVQDINDLLKSMVVRDLDGGVISTVSYDSNAPVERTLKSFAINLNGNPAFGQILNQARGEKVEVVLQQTGATQPGTLTGTIVGVEQQKQAAAKDTVEIELLNLWCADGMRSLKMAEVQRVRFLNPVIDSEFKKALETLAQSHDTQKKAVSISCLGEGKRSVKVGYVVENPIWKTSYRLVLDKDRKEKPFLQGWAVVENPSDEDWKDVRMALVSGRPISFQMNLYDPLYVSRPVVEPELFASLRPVAYSGGIPASDFGLPTGQNAGAVDQKKVKELADSWGALPEKERAKATLEQQKQLGERMDLGGGGARSMATAAKLGDFFKYSIDKPVSLARQKSAMLPIVNKDVEGTRVSIYNEKTQAKFPLLGLKLKNTSGLHLMQGPITVFEGSNYAGDARILDLQPNEERLLSYAVDLGTEVNPVPSSDNGRITKVKAVKGVIWTETKIRESKTYTVVNRNDQERVVLVEHPVRNEFKLVDTVKPAETASDFYRFEVKVAAGKTETLTVTEERVVSENVQLTSGTNDDQIRFFISQTASSQKVKDGLKRALELKWEFEKTRREIGELDRQLKTITDDQARLRANLKEMPSTAAAYKRYLEKFDQQETQIEEYQASIKKLQAVEHEQRKKFDDFLADFSAE
jgi:hypothetical protein